MSDPFSSHDARSGALFHFKGSLPRFLVPARGRKRKWLPLSEPGALIYPVHRATNVKDAIEAMGPPHSIIGSLSINGSDSDFNHRLTPEDTVIVHPPMPPVDVSLPTTLLPNPFKHVCFAVDANVGKLASKLRILGFDTLYDPGLDDEALVVIAAKEQRIVVSKDRGLLKRKLVTHAFLAASENPDEQLLSLLIHFGLTPPFATFSRCLECNAKLAPVDKAQVLHRLEPLTKLYYQSFHICPGCGRIYWKGSHADHLQGWLHTLTQSLDAYTRP